MKPSLRTRRQAATLLAGLLIALSAVPVRANEPALDPDLKFVSPEATAFVTIRAADLAGKLGIKDGKHPWAVAWQKQIGIPLNHVERCTIVNPNIFQAGPTCFILHTNAPIQRDAVLAAYAADAREEKYERKVCHVSPKTNTAVYFASDSIMLAGDTEAVKKCLADLGKMHTKMASFTEALALSQSAKHDVILWNRAEAVPDDNGPYPAPHAVPYNFRTPKSGDKPTVTVARKPKLEVVKEDDLAEATKEKMTSLSILPNLPLAGMQSAMVVVDVGDELYIGMGLHCADEAAAKKAEKMLRAVVGLTHAELMGLVSQLDLLDASPSLKEESAEFDMMPKKLLRQAEMGLQEARVRTDDKMVGVVIKIPIDTKTLRSELATVVKWSEKSGDTCTPAALFQTTMPASSLPPRPSNWIAPPPQDMPISVPAPGVTINVPPASLQPATVKIAVANVRKEAALLFTVGDNGKLNFVQKVPAGEAVDVQMTSGQRWVAVFTDNPAGEMFVPTPGSETWLLRGAAHANPPGEKNAN